MSDPSQIISYSITRFPQNLLIPDVDNDVTIQVMSNSDKIEYIRLSFEGEQLNISHDLEGLTDKIEINPGEAKNIDLKLIPVSDGFGKLSLNLYWLKIIEYSVKVKKVREKIVKSKINEIFKKYEGTSESIEVINPNEYLIKISRKEIRQIEPQLEQLPSKEKDIQIIKLAKGYLSNNELQKSLDLALKLSSSKEREDFYCKLTRVYALKDTENTLEIIKNLTDDKLKQTLLKHIAIDQISNNPEQAIRVAKLILDDDLKETTFTYILTQVFKSDSKRALNSVKTIDDGFLKAKLLLQLGKLAFEKNKSELKSIISQINENLKLSLDKIDGDKKLRKKIYSLLKDSINIIAEIENPKIADSVIEHIKNPEFKEKIEKDLFDTIYETVDEIKTKIEQELISSQYFLFNTYTSSITNEIINFSQIGGNISNNILAHTFDFNVALFSLFSFNFSIFPLIDRVYNDVKFDLKKSIGYYIFPSKSNYDDQELIILKRILSHFFKNLDRLSGQMLIFNLDFIPYLGKPTIIVSSEPNGNDILTSKIKKLGDKVNLTIDDSLFKGGKIFDTLSESFPLNKCKVINLILSYEFINDYNLFKAFVELLI